MIYVIHAAIIVSISAIICVWWFHRCHHDWVIIRETKIMSRDNNYKMPVGLEFVMQCKKCGVIKSTEV